MARNVNIVQTTKMMVHPHLLTNMTHCCFLIFVVTDVVFQDLFEYANRKFSPLSNSIQFGRKPYFLNLPSHHLKSLDTCPGDSELKTLCSTVLICLVAQSCLPLCDSMDCCPTRLLCPGDFPGNNIGVGSHSHLQGFFLTEGSNPGFLHCRWILYYLNHQGYPPSS